MHKNIYKIKKKVPKFDIGKIKEEKSCFMDEYRHHSVKK